MFDFCFSVVTGFEGLPPRATYTCLRIWGRSLGLCVWCLGIVFNLVSVHLCNEDVGRACVAAGLNISLACGLRILDCVSSRPLFPDSRCGLELVCSPSASPPPPQLFSEAALLNPTSDSGKSFE